MMPAKTTAKRRTTAKKTDGKKTAGKKTVRSPAKYSATQIADAKKLATAVWNAGYDVDFYELSNAADEYGMSIPQFKKVTIAADTNAILEGHVKRVIEPVCFEEAREISAPQRRAYKMAQEYMRKYPRR